MRTYAIAENPRMFEQYLKETKQKRGDVIFLWGANSVRGIRGKLVLIGDAFKSAAYDHLYIDQKAQDGEIEIEFYGQFYG